jgi:hypothetical protein
MLFQNFDGRIQGAAVGQSDRLQWGGLVHGASSFVSWKYATPSSPFQVKYGIY